MQLNIKPSHAKVREYYSAFNQFGQLNISHETAEDNLEHIQRLIR